MNDLQNLPRPVPSSARAGDGETRYKIRVDLDVITETKDPFGRTIQNRMGVPHVGHSRYYVARPGDVEAVKTLHCELTGISAELARREKSGEAPATITYAITELPD